MKIDRADTEKRLFVIELRKMTAENLQETYLQNFQKFSYRNSGSAELDGQPLGKGLERFMASLDSRNTGKTVVLDGETTNGFEICEADFLEYEVARVERLLSVCKDELPLESKKAAQGYLKLLKYKPLFVKVKKPVSAPTTIPEALQTEEASALLTAAIEKGLCTSDYEWRQGKELLAYFASKASDRLGLGKGEDGNGRRRISWRPFEELFNMPRGSLRLNLNDIQKRGDYPSDSHLVDDIF